MNVVFNCIDFLISLYILIIHLIEFYNQSQVERLVYGTWIKWLNQQNRVCECSNEVKSTAEFIMYIENVLKIPQVLNIQNFNIWTTIKYKDILFYYIDMSVLLENVPLVKFIKTSSRTRVVYFP